MGENEILWHSLTLSFFLSFNPPLVCFGEQTTTGPACRFVLLWLERVIMTSVVWLGIARGHVR